ncbi:MAG: hypothetical protein V4671_04775 [Armatimonadota bacterium]
MTAELQTGKSKSDEIQHPKKGAMLAALAKTGNVTAAAKAAKIDRSTHYEWMQSDSSYVIAAQDAIEAAGDNLEEEARRRAEAGYMEPVYYGGEKVGSVRKYSDALLIFLLKGAKPEKYKERIDTRHSGSLGVAHMDLSKLPQGKLDTLEAILQEAATVENTES